MNGGGWDCTVQGSSPHKCNQKSCCSAFNAVVTVFLLDISAFLSSLYVPEVHSYRWKFLEGHLNLHLSTCFIKHLLWLSVNGGDWDCTVQGFSPHKCNYKSCYSAFNVVVTTFLLDIYAFLFSSYMLEVYPYCWKFLEGHLSHPSICLTDIHHIRER